MTSPRRSRFVPSAITESKKWKSPEKLAEEVIKRVVTEFGKAKPIGPAAK